MSEQSKVVVITGASSGIGRATALQFAAEGARVALLARRQALIETLAKEIEQAGGKAIAIPTDVTNREQVQAAVTIIEKLWQRIDVLINNAGYGVYGTVENCEPEDFEGQIQVNYLGVVYTTKAFLPLMRRQRSGTIINVSSICGKVVTPLDSGYCASKFALNAFTTILRKELENTGISVCLVCPGFTETGWENAVVQRSNRSPLRRILPAMSSEYVAKIIVTCSRKPKPEIIIPNILRLIILAQNIMPKFYEWFYFKVRYPKSKAATKP